MGDIGAAFSAAEIVPQIIPLPPQQQLNVRPTHFYQTHFNFQVTFEGIRVQPGQELQIRNLKNAPRITLQVDPESTFSLVMIDPDNLSRKNPSVAEWLQWLVVNIPASNINEGINGGQHQQPYGSPAPQPRTGDHRYIIVLFEHPNRRLAVPKFNTRAKFSLKQFIEKHKLGKLSIFTYLRLLSDAPIAGMFFTAKNPQQ
jgi:phosphatidylethanolamine-binding protein (PEBP) family uncharacterized protein